MTNPILLGDTDDDDCDGSKFLGDDDCDDVGDPLTNDVSIDDGKMPGGAYASSWLGEPRPECSPAALRSVRLISFTGCLVDHAASLQAFYWW